MKPADAKATHASARAVQRSPVSTGSIYQQFRGPGGVIIHWLPEQMPLKVYVAPGTSLDSIIDPELGAPYTNVDKKEFWPDLIASVIKNPEQLQSLSLAQGYVQEHYQAAVAGINMWKGVSGGKYSFEITEDPGDADIYVFWTNHFVNKMGLALFENDIRGYTAKRSFPLQAVLNDPQKVPFKPVITLLRTVDGAGNPMPLVWMKASAAHEFGHALGIEGHSPNRSDLMSVFYGRGVISPNDAATIHFLYGTTPNYIP